MGSFPETYGRESLNCNPVCKIVVPLSFSLIALSNFNNAYNFQFFVF